MADGRYLYCVAPGGHGPPSDLTGVDGREVRSVDHEGLTVWCSDIAERPVPSLDRIRRHDDVVRSAMTATTTPVPVRFGQWFPTRATMLEELDGERDRFGALLRKLGGTREYAVRVLERTPTGSREEATVNAGSGREYLEGLARREAEVRATRERGRELAEALASHLGGLVRDQRAETLEPPDGLLSVAHLVATDDAERYRDAVRGFAGDRGEVDFRVTGPWPPYSFVT